MDKVFWQNIMVLTQIAAFSWLSLKDSPIKRLLNDYYMTANDMVQPMYCDIS